LAVQKSLLYPRECLEIKNDDGGKDFFVQQGGMWESRLEASVPHDNAAEQKKPSV